MKKMRAEQEKKEAKKRTTNLNLSFLRKERPYLSS